MLKIKNSHRLFSTLQKTTGKLINGGIEEYYLSKVKSGALRNDANQFALVQKLNLWGDSFMKNEPRILEFKEDYSKVANLGNHS